MFRFARALTLPLALMLAAAPALAADNWTAKDGNGNLFTFRSKDTGTGQAQFHVMADGTGTAYSSTNPLATLLNAGTAHVGSFNLDQVGGTAVSLGQKASAASIPVVLSAEQEAILAAVKAANGTPADPSYTGSNTATQIALLKAAVTSLATIALQAAPTSNPGTSINSTTGVPGFQGVTGGVPVNTALASLPAFAATPLVNLGIGGTALTLGQKAMAASLPVTLPSDQVVSVDTVIKGTGTDAGGTIATASTAQTFMAANANRRSWSVQNQSTGDLYVNCSATATLDYHSLKVPAGALYESASTHVGTGACSIIGATAGQAFYARSF